MYHNFEIKARYDKFEFAKDQAEKLGARLFGTDKQIDTYFKTAMGKFKLRLSELSEPYLIPYLRPDEKEIRHSRYEKIPVSDPESIKSIFDQILGIRIEIKKTRAIYLYENVRIHLDEVEGLGRFIELEGVFDPENSDEKIEKMKIEQLIDYFDIESKAMISSSYYDLFLEANEKN